MCTCVDTVNAKLAEYNTKLSKAWVFGGKGNNPWLMLKTEQIETGCGKKKASEMFAAHCPFCGEKYDTGAA